MLVTAPLTPAQDADAAAAATPGRIGARHAFYGLYYLVSFVLNSDIISALMTLPMFAIILWSLRYCRPDRIGQLDMVALVYFLFFCIVPLQQVDGTVFTYGEIARGFRYPYEDFALVHALALASYLLLVFGVAWSQDAPAPDYTFAGLLRPAMLAIALVACVANIFVQGGLENVLAPRYLKEASIIGQISPAFLGVQSVCTLLYFLAARRSLAPWDLAAGAFLLALLLLMANPLNVARYALVGVWAPLLLLLLPRLLRPAVFYTGSLLTLILLVPLLSLTTRLGLVASRQVTDELSYGSLFTLKNLNVFEMALESVAYVRRSGLRWGETFASTIFIHIPRAWWPDKPVASNLEVGRNLTGFYRYTNENLAVPWFMDGYLDAWLPGSLLFGVLAALLIRYLNRKVRYLVAGVDIYALFFISNFLILARGTVAVVFTLFLFQVLCLIFMRRSGLLVMEADGVVLRDPEEAATPWTAARAV